MISCNVYYTIKLKYFEVASYLLKRHSYEFPIDKVGDDYVTLILTDKQAKMLKSYGINSF